MKPCMKIISIILALALILALPACGGKTPNTAPATEQPESAADPYDADGGESEAIDTEAPAEEEWEEPDYATESFPIFQFETEFSEGRAWVRYYPEPETDANYCQYALIDETGHACLILDEPGTPVSGGYTLSAFDGGFDIYDADGYCTFSSYDSEDYQLTVVGQGDGRFAVVEHATGFSGNTYSLYEIDGEGNEISERYEIGPLDKYDRTSPDKREFTWLGCGVFACNSAHRYLIDGKLLDLNQSSIGLLPYGVALETPFIDGVSVARKTETVYNGPWDTVTTVTLEDLSSLEAAEAWFENSKGFGLIHNAVISPENLVTIYGADWEEHAYQQCLYDYSGNLLGYYPGYPEGVSYVVIGAYRGGYAPLVLRGADGFFYVTMLDAQGAQMYDPVCLGKNLQGSMSFSGLQYTISDFGQYSDGVFFYNTYLFTGETGFVRIGLDGVSAPLEGLPENSELRFADPDYVYFNRTGLTHHDGQVVLDCLWYEVYDDEYEEDWSDGENEEKAYIDPSSFVIEGKWKSIGTYGFGQAQPGAIVVFDGSNCNLFSPSDTYAFYKSGGSFILDCTGIMGGTETFTVKIVDEDNIDLWNGGYVTELTRVG